VGDAGLSSAVELHDLRRQAHRSPNLRKVSDRQAAPGTRRRERDLRELAPARPAVGPAGQGNELDIEGQARRPRDPVERGDRRHLVARLVRRERGVRRPRTPRELAQ
jgi:hypothetical protein